MSEAATRTPGAARDAAFGVARSYLGRRWQLAPSDEGIARELIQNSGLSPVLAQAPAAAAGVWNQVTDPNSGRPYWYNTATKETSWVKPF